MCYQDVDDDATLSPGCLTYNLREKNFKYFHKITVIYNVFAENSAAKVDISHCVLTFEENVTVCFTEMHNMNMPEGVPT